MRLLDRKAPASAGPSQASENGHRPPPARSSRDGGSLLRSAGRVLLWLFIALVLIRGIRDILTPPARPAVPAGAAGAVGARWPDDQARAFAVRFARAYLTFSLAHPAYQGLAVRPYLTSTLRTEDAVALPRRGPDQTVAEATVAAAAPLDAGHALITVAATVLDRTVTTRYLTVPVARDAQGGLVVFDAPSFTSPPPAVADSSAPDLPEVQGAEAGAIADLVRRFLPAYLAGADGGQLAYFLAPGAQIAALGHPYQLLELVSLAQPDDSQATTRTVLALTRVRDPESRALYTLRYRLVLVRRERWYVTSIQGGST